MTATRIVYVFIAVVLPALWAAGADKPGPAGFDGACWVWAPTQDTTPPEGACYIRGSLILPDGAKVKSAEIAITADNLFSLYVNGKYAWQGDFDPLEGVFLQEPADTDDQIAIAERPAAPDHLAIPLEQYAKATSSKA